MNKQNLIINTIKNNPDGFTLKLTTLKPYEKNKSFAVGLTNLKSKNPNRLIKKVLYISKGFNQIKNNLFIGGWYNQEDKNYYLDLSLIIEELNNSEYVGRLFNQISIFNFKELKCINLKND